MSISTSLFFTGVMMKSTWESVSSDPIVYLFPSLSHVDMTKLEAKLVIISSAIVVFLLVFVASFLTSYRFLNKLNEKITMCRLRVQNLFVLFGCFFGIWYFAIDDTLNNDMVNAHTKSSHTVIYVFIAFFLFDTVTIVIYNFALERMDPSVFAHHSLCLACIGIIQYYNALHGFALTFILLEVVLPCMGLSWVLWKLNLSHSLIWKFNQAVVIHLFHCSLLMEAYVLYKMYKHWDDATASMPRLALYFLIAVVLFLLIFFTPYWTYKKTRHLFKEEFEREFKKREFQKKSD